MFFRTICGQRFVTPPLLALSRQMARKRKFLLGVHQVCPQFPNHACLKGFSLILTIRNVFRFCTRLASVSGWRSPHPCPSSQDPWNDSSKWVPPAAILHSESTVSENGFPWQGDQTATINIKVGFWKWFHPQSNYTAKLNTHGFCKRSSAGRETAQRTTHRFLKMSCRQGAYTVNTTKHCLLKRGALLSS